MERLNKQERHKLVHERLSQLAMRMSELFNWELDGEQSEITYTVRCVPRRWCIGAYDAKNATIHTERGSQIRNCRISLIMFDKSGIIDSKRATKKLSSTA